MNFRCFALLGLSLLLLPARSRADEESLGRLMPPTTVAFVEVVKADLLADKALDPALVSLLEQSRKVQKYYDSPQYRKGKVAIALVEARMNMKWPEIVKHLAGSVSMGFDSQTTAGLLVLRPKDAQTLSKLQATLLDLVELDAASKGKPSPAQSKPYNDVTTWTLGDDSHHAVVDGLLLASNKPEGLEALIDRLKNPELESLADAPDFQTARAAFPANQAAWGVVRMDAARSRPKLQEALTRESDNLLAELLLGGILDVLRDTPTVAGSLQVDHDHWQLKLQAPRVGNGSQERAWYFKHGAQPTAALKPEGTILSLTLDRDLAGMWMARDELFDEATRAKLAQADSGLGLYFAGRDFGTQVLGELGPQWQLVVTRQQFIDGQPIPSVKFPAVALVMQMKHPDELATTLLLGYQKIIGLVNLAGTEKGGPQLLLGSETYQGVTISKATFLAPPETDLNAASVHYNASPSCARVGDQFIIGSTVGVVKAVIDELQHPEAEAQASQTAASADLQQLAAIFADNREAIISQTMLREGLSREETESEVSFLLTVLERICQADMKLAIEPQRLNLEFSAGPKP